MSGIIKFGVRPEILASSAVGGYTESNGNLGRYFDLTDPTDKFGKKTFEQAESEMQRLALNFALKKSGLGPEDLEAVFAGDLMNQCTGSSFGLAGFGIPFFGLYGACSTAAESLILAAMSVNAGYFSRAAAVSSSHNSAAERQFRFPLGYGCQRPPTSQWTATASGAFIIGKGGESTGVALTEALPGRIVDKGITDQSNMGAAMAPAAAATLYTYFTESGNHPDDFDLILTGDLGREGHEICYELLSSSGLRLGENFTDCGILLYDSEAQDLHSGGSGCGCSAAVTAGFIMKRFAESRLRNVLLVGTGALMSPTSVLQGLAIPGIAHLVRFSSL